MNDFFLEGIRANLAAFLDVCPVTDATRSAAYHVLENAGLLRRLEPGHPILGELARLPAVKRCSLVILACEYMGEFNLLEPFKTILQKEKLEDYDMDFFESLLIRRDALESALRYAEDLVGDARLIHTSFLHSYWEYTREIDDLLLDHPDTLRLGSQVLTPAVDSPFWLSRFIES